MFKETRKKSNIFLIHFFQGLNLGKLQNVVACFIDFYISLVNCGMTSSSWHNHLLTGAGLFQCFFHQEPCEKRWKPTSFSCQVVETLIALFTAENVTPVEAESKMEDWGGSPIKVCMLCKQNNVIRFTQASLSWSNSKGALYLVVNIFTKLYCRYAISFPKPLSIWK